MTRMAMIKVATTLGISSDLIASGEKIVFVVGHQEIGFLDLIHVVDTAKESEVITGRGIVKIAEVVNPEIFQAVLNLVVELADKGREGKPIGTIFVVGDHEKVLQLSRQMIINPFKGYTEEERHILSPGLKETIREFAALDGAFVISDDGTLLTAGRYLGAASDEANLPRGLGSRHIAASGITSLTKAVAFVISESSGDVRIFKDGKIVMHIEKAPSKR
ncbi:MAG: DNA integrity scanning protein DisA nucleotide-binding domain protein [Deltaproteobacteria bacterium]|nr:DNA integrity scanning protein DisA nucleotide-binding domain protein [Deltaproteobacteria bacterium]